MNYVPGTILADIDGDLWCFIEGGGMISVTGNLDYCEAYVEVSGHFLAEVEHWWGPLRVIFDAGKAR